MPKKGARFASGNPPPGPAAWRQQQQQQKRQASGATKRTFSAATTVAYDDDDGKTAKKAKAQEGSQERLDEKIAALTKEAAEWRIKAAHYTNLADGHIKKIAALRAQRKAAPSTEEMLEKISKEADAALLEMEEEEQMRKEVARAFKARQDDAAAADAEEVEE